VAVKKTSFAIVLEKVNWQSWFVAEAEAASGILYHSDRVNKGPEFRCTIT
jgi:hypothetical protein